MVLRKNRTKINVIRILIHAARGNNRNELKCGLDELVEEGGSQRT